MDENERELTRDEKWAEIEEAVLALVDRLTERRVIAANRGGRIAIALLAAFRLVNLFK